MPQPDAVPPGSRSGHPSWSRHAAIYELNLRHFTRDGTLAAARSHLPRLADLGVGIIWLMPIHPIGVAHRKGLLGSPYAVRDHFGVNLEFGNLAELRAFVADAHHRGLRVLLDWVAHHTAWDHDLVTRQPEWYRRDEDGQLRRTPLMDWDDIVDLDYRQPGLWHYMVDAMEYWVRQADVDGFRCDLAGLVPWEFWEHARRQLQRVKPVFLLAEWDWTDTPATFDAGYGWSWHSALRGIAGQQAPVSDLARLYRDWAGALGGPVMPMTFVTNHDENAWQGSDGELFGPALPAAAALSVLGPGIPLLFNGQEAGLDRRLPFFDTDEIDWAEHPRSRLYRTLLGVKRRHRALWNPPWGAPLTAVATDLPRQVFAFTRSGGGERVLVAVNLSPGWVRVRLTTTGRGAHNGTGPSDRWAGPGVRDALSGRPARLPADRSIRMPPWGFRVLVAHR
ncbi:MAG TPA: alpha-amylase family glycosyl hydrolase [Dermatophilaceae bacterium]|nr:alpha-amylase family glycosyl hydrolase [Dermatophilaceae bacterium]